MPIHPWSRTGFRCPTLLVRASAFPALALCSLLLGCQEPNPGARAYVIGDLSEAIGGPKALAQPGDFILENDRIRIAILGPHNSMGPHTSGASIVDADLQRNDPRYSHGHGRDQLAEIFPTVNLNVQQADDDDGEVVILADGSDGGDAIICTEGPEASFIQLLDGLWQILGEPDMRIRTDYTLSPGSGAVHISTTAVMGAESSCDTDLDATVEFLELVVSNTEMPLLDWALQTGAALGDFYLQGGSVNVFTSGVGFDEKGFIAARNAAGINSFQQPIPVDFLAGTGDEVSYGLMPSSGRLFIPLFTSSQTVAMGGGAEGDGTVKRFADGTALRYDRWFAVGEGDVGSVLDALLEAKEINRGWVSGQVLEAHTGIPLSGIQVYAFQPGAEQPWSQWITDVGRDDVADGSFGGTLPVGTWELQVHGQGRPDGERIQVEVECDASVDLVLSSPRAGSVGFRIVDETGMLVPAKLTLMRVDGPSPLNPDLGDPYISGDVAHVAFAAEGTGDVVLPPGSYQAIASRGIEYELDTSETFELTEVNHVELELQVVRSVDTTGWVGADFHVHAEGSHDSGVSLADRVATMAAEGVEFLASTDHDVLTDYGPTIEALGMEHWISSTVGLEVTTIELGHFLGFPLHMDHTAEAGGALDWTGLEPQEILDGIRELGIPGNTEPLVFLGHPRDGILGFFDQYGLDPYSVDESGDLVLDAGFLGLLNTLLAADLFTMDFEAMEVFNAKRFELIRTPTQPELDAYAADGDNDIAYEIIERTMDEQLDLEEGIYTLGYGPEGTLDDWFHLLNLGYRITALGNSDTHCTTSTESGCPRNFVMADTDDPAYLDEYAIAEAVKAGRVVASYGPFIRFWTGDETQGPGSMVSASGEVSFEVEVQSPSWFDVDRVEIYRNGTLIQEITITTPNVDVLNLATSFEDTPDQDSWYAVVALGHNDMAPVFTPVEIPQIQLQDIVVDALSGIETVASLLGSSVPIPRAFPIYPYAVTNPIWIDQDGDGEFTPPGMPEWLVAPVEPQ